MVILFLNKHFWEDNMYRSGETETPKYDCKNKQFTWTGCESDLFPSKLSPIWSVVFLWHRNGCDVWFTLGKDLSTSSFLKEGVCNGVENYGEVVLLQLEPGGFKRVLIVSLRTMIHQLHHWGVNWRFVWWIFWKF